MTKINAPSATVVVMRGLDPRITLPAPLAYGEAWMASPARTRMFFNLDRKAKDALCRLSHVRA